MCKRACKYKYGLLPPKEADAIQWKILNVDFWGPTSNFNVNCMTDELHVMTMVDLTTGLFEQQQLYGPPTAYRCQGILDNVWLFCDPRPAEIGFNNEAKFKVEFNELCNNIGMHQKPSKAWNSQSNEILERVHQVLVDILEVFDLEGTPIHVNLLQIQII